MREPRLLDIPDPTESLKALTWGLPAGSEVAIVDCAAHFLQLEQPDKAAHPILTFIGAAG